MGAFFNDENADKSTFMWYNGDRDRVAPERRLSEPTSLLIVIRNTIGGAENGYYQRVKKTY